MRTIIGALGILIVSSFNLSVSAQQAATGVSGPQGIPPEIAQMLGTPPSGMDTAQGTIASPEQPKAGLGPKATAGAGTKYLYNTLRVIADGNPPGCSASNWNCMSNLCKTDLNDQNAWRGWAGCWTEGAKYICYFECSQARDAF